MTHPQTDKRVSEILHTMQALVGGDEYLEREEVPPLIAHDAGANQVAVTDGLGSKPCPRQFLRHRVLPFTENTKRNQTGISVAEIAFAAFTPMAKQPKPNCNNSLDDVEIVMLDEKGNQAIIHKEGIVAIIEGAL